jgi:hypothetical protein
MPQNFFFRKKYEATGIARSNIRYFTRYVPYQLLLIADLKEK